MWLIILTGHVESHDEREDGATRQTSEKQYRLQRSNRLWSVSVIIYHECSRRVHLRFRVALIFSLSDQEIRLQTCTWQIQTLYCILGEDIKFLFNLAWHIPITPLHWTLGCPPPSFDPKDQAGKIYRIPWPRWKNRKTKYDYIKILSADQTSQSVDIITQNVLRLLDVAFSNLLFINTLLKSDLTPYCYLLSWLHIINTIRKMNVTNAN